MQGKICIITFYKFIQINDIESLKIKLENIKNNDIKLDSIVISQSNKDDVGENLTMSSLSNHIEDIPIYFLDRNENNKNHIIDQILKL